MNTILSDFEMQFINQHPDLHGRTIVGFEMMDGDIVEKDHDVPQLVLDNGTRIVPDSDGFIVVPFDSHADEFLDSFKIGG